jgi:hypothetical protein
MKLYEEIRKYNTIPDPHSLCPSRVVGIAAQPGACMYLGRRAGGYIPHSTSRVIRRCIDLCALPAADPLDPGPLLPSEPDRICRNFQGSDVGAMSLVLSALLRKLWAERWLVLMVPDSSLDMDVRQS